MFEDQHNLEFSEASAARSILYPGAKAKRDAIKAAGGAEYAALLEYERAARTKFRAKNPDHRKKYRERRGYSSNRMGVPFKTYLCAHARQRGRKRGLAATISPDDLIWPTHCPVLGIELDYPKLSGERKNRSLCANWPSLDRWDNTKGYVPGNVFVISMRANTLKNSATYEEILKVAKYLSRRPR
jgi:hypothetical protein